MATNDVQLNAGIRSNLLLLQETSVKLERTQLRLATGNKINSALDGPAGFFASKGLNQRAGDLTGLKDGIGQAISTIKAADTGITKIEALVEQARGLTTQALGQLGTDANSVALRNSLANQFNNVLRQIDSLASDASYAGKNLLIGSGLRLDATASTKTSVNALAGISGARATNVVSADEYTISVTGDGAIEGSSNDIANAEQARGISNLVVNGFASTTQSNFDSISIKLGGGKGKDKTFTLTEGSETITQTFTTAQWDAAKADGEVLRFSYEFKSGTNVSFDVDFDAIEDVPDTAGVGTSIIEKNVNLQILATNQNGETITRDGLNLLGQAKVADGENAFAFDSGTARITVDERQILQASKYSQAASASYGTGAGAITGTPTTSGAIPQDETFTLTAQGSSYNYQTGNFNTYSATLQGTNSTGVDTQAVTGTTVTFNSASLDTTVTLDVNVNDLKYIATAASAGTVEINSTKAVAASSVLVAANFSATAQSGFSENRVSNLTFTVTGPADSATLTVSDGTGGAFSSRIDLGSTTDIAIAITGGVNDGAVLSLNVSAAGTALSNAASAGSNVSATFSFQVRGEFTGSREAKFDVRAANTGQSATLETKQLVDGTDANNMAVQLNETNTSNVTVVSQNVRTDGQGLKLDFAQNGWNDRADIDNAIKQLDTAKLTLRAASSNLSTNLNVIQTRESYTKEFSDVLVEGANKLVQADQNEEGANILTLQTKQQLGTISLSLANQAQQAILRLF
ncbi:flagellin [Dongia sp.]|uniref:flagellin N-terminal helical domain-containing protein n=1 Tax=Dongia sp. TaxID=1977262 RepID=UPI0035B1F05C